jgi:hypothetical protein
VVRGDTKRELLLMITLKDPIRFAAIASFAFVFFNFASVTAGWAFLLGSLVGSISFEKRKRPGG